MKYCVRLKTTPARIRRRFTIASKSPVNGVSSRPRVSAGSASYGEGTSGSLSPSSPCGRGGRFPATDFEPVVPTASRPPGADDEELGDDEQLAVRQSRPTSAAYVRNEVITKSALSSFSTTALARLGQRTVTARPEVPRPALQRASQLYPQPGSWGE